MFLLFAKIMYEIAPKNQKFSIFIPDTRRGLRPWLDLSDGSHNPLAVFSFLENCEFD
jgi:hypothetical protein